MKSFALCLFQRGARGELIVADDDVLDVGEDIIAWLYELAAETLSRRVYEI